MNLLVDIGNTRVKWCIDKKGVINTGVAFEYRQVDLLPNLQQSWLKLETPQLLAISSVSSSKIAHIITSLAKKRWPDIKILFAQSMRKGFSVTNAYSEADKLGVDRWLGLIALQKFYPGNSCVIDCGTAVTLDCLNSQGLHLGGLICPGLQLMKQSLYQGTEDLSYNQMQYPIRLSNSTESAIYSGTVYAVTGLIESVVKNLCVSQSIILTGGDAVLLSNHLELETIIEPDFVLKGLSLFCRGENVE